MIMTDKLYMYQIILQKIRTILIIIELSYLNCVYIKLKPKTVCNKKADKMGPLISHQRKR